MIGEIDPGYEILLASSAGRISVGVHMRSERTGQVLRAVYALVSVLAGTALVAALLRYRLDCPKGEQWYFMFTVEKAFNGTLTFGDLWALEAEHRHLFPHLLMIGTALLSRWSFTPELLVNAGLAGLTGFALSWQVGLLWNRGRASWLHALTPVFAVMVWSLSQVECWLWSYEMVTFMSVCAATWSLALLARPASREGNRQAGEAHSRRGTLSFAAATALAVVSSYSFANGFMVWPAGFVVMVLATSGRERVRRLVAWCLVAAVTAGLFAIGYHLPPWSAPGQVARSPLAFVRFVLIFFGGPIGVTMRAVDIAAGIAGLLAFCWLVVRAVRRPGGRDVALLPIGLGAFVMASAIVIAFGRANLGDPTHTRYLTTSLLFWAGLTMLLYGEARRSEFRQGMRLVSSMAIVLIAAMFVFQSVRALKDCRWYHSYFGAAQKHLLTLKIDDPILRTPLPKELTQQNTPLLRILPWDPPVQLLVDTLKRNQLNVFAVQP